MVILDTERKCGPMINLDVAERIFISYLLQRTREIAQARMGQSVDLPEYCRSSIHDEDTVGDVSGSVSLTLVESNPI